MVLVDTRPAVLHVMVELLFLLQVGLRLGWMVVRITMVRALLWRW